MNTGRRNILAIVLICSGVYHADAATQTPAVWGDLKPGPYTVGYRVDFEFDRSRAYRPAVDWLGRPESKPSGRPMQVSIWYPADPATGGDRKMTYGDYVRQQAGALGPHFDTPDRRREFELALTRGPLSPYFEDGVSDDDLARVLATPMAAVHGAPPAHGRFPVVIHGGFSLAGQSVLLEYLASHGYVVLSVPLLGTASAWFGRGHGTPEWYQTGADDAGFLHAYAHELEFADPTRTAMIGMFSAFGLLYQMQHMQLDALVSLDGNYPTDLRSIPGFDSVAVRIPILDMPRSDVGGDRSILLGLRFADRYLVDLADVTHGDFYQFQRVAHPEKATEHVSYRIIAETTLNFLESALAADQSFGTRLDGHGRDLRHLPAAAPIPTREEFLLLIREGRFSDARLAWEQSTCTDNEHEGKHCLLVPESDFMTTLLFFRRDHGPASARDGFILLCDMYPDSEDACRHLETTRQADDGE